MKKIKYIAFSLFVMGLFFSNNIQAQSKLTGVVYELDRDNKQVPLPMVNIFWLGTTLGTVADDKGAFSIIKPEAGNLQLVCSFMGYKTDTINIEKNQAEVSILMFALTQNIQGIEISEKMESSYISKLSTQKTEVITTEGLTRLACCNLAESFENSATVDVGYSDAVSGARQIQMLGLTGVYSQLILENVPFIRGLSAPFGLNYIPGPFMESIQISKGVASVINGYETVTGQVNIEYRKPLTSDRLYVNAYLNSDLKNDFNVIGAHEFNEKLSTMLFAHQSSFNREIDHVGHGDGFMDYPKFNQWNLVNRWNYTHKKYTNITLINYVKEKRTGGQMGFDRSDRTMDTAGLYGIGIDNQRLQLFTKNGVLLNEKNSIGLQLSGTYFQQKAFYGLNDYKGDEADLYANLIYEGLLTDKHKFNAGASFQLNNTKETYTSQNIYSLFDTVMKTDELVPGVFVQYTYTLSKFLLTAGLRYDYNSAYERSLITPRLHLKWDPLEHSVFRISAGKGYRSAFVLAENFGLMASSRKFVFSDESLKMEDAWNYGFNFVQDILIKDKKIAVFTLDFYRTDFVNQIIVDLDKSADEVHFYNLEGKSFSNSLQADLVVSVVKGFTATLAGRYNDVKTTTDGQLQDRVYMNKWKGLLVLSYATKYDKWTFDLTTQLNGAGRLPNTNNARPEYSSPYFYMLGQITRRFKHWDVYIGCENITGYVQEHPIIDPEHPYAKDFDASVIYAPIMGRLFYAGFRWTLK